MKKIGLIKEDLAKAKKLIRNREMMKRAASQLGYLDSDTETARSYSVGEIRTLTPKHFTQDEMVEISKVLRDMKISPEDIKNIERDEKFQQIVKMCSKNIGWTFMFTYFYFYENATIEELESLMASLYEMKGLLKDLKKPFDVNYIDPKIPNNMEHLIDELGKLGIKRSGRKMYNQLTPELKQSYHEATDYIKEKFNEIALGFSRAGTKKGVLDKELNQSIWKSFFGYERLDTHPTLPDGTPNPNFNKMTYFSELKRYKTIQQFLERAEKYLDSMNVNGVSDFISDVNDINKKLGNSGVDIIENENNIIVVRVNSFAANRQLNSHTTHCIVTYFQQWESYVSNHPNIQYYIYNFNFNISTNSYGTFGITIDPQGNFYRSAAFDKNNVGMGKGELYHIFDKWTKEYELSFDLKSVFVPMDEKEVRKWNIKVNSNKGIISDDLDIEKLNEYVLEGGADVNTTHRNIPAYPLYSAVNRDEVQLVEKLLEFGAIPTLYPELGNAIKSKEVLRLLVPSGIRFEQATASLAMIYEDYDDFEWFMNNGFDPNFNQQLVLSKCIRGTYLNKDNIGEAYNKQIELLFNKGAWCRSDRDHLANKVGNNNGKEIVLEWCSRYCRIETVKLLERMGILDKANVDFMDYFRAIIQVLKVNGNNQLNTMEASIPRALQIETCDYYMTKIEEDCNKKGIPFNVDVLLFLAKRGSLTTEEMINESDLTDSDKEALIKALNNKHFSKIRCVLIPTNGMPMNSINDYLNTKR